MDLFNIIAKPFRLYFAWADRVRENLWREFREARAMARAHRESSRPSQPTDLVVPVGAGNRVNRRLCMTAFNGMPSQAELNALAQLDREDLEQDLIRQRIKQLEQRRELERRYRDLHATS